MGRAPGNRSILVPLGMNAESETAFDVACRLAAERGCSLTAIAVVEVPALLPVDAHMVDEEAAARRLLDRAAAVGDSYGIDVRQRLVRAREAATAIVEEASARNTELIVLGTSRKRARPFGRTAGAVLKGAACRVMLIAPPANAVQARIAV